RDALIQAAWLAGSPALLGRHFPELVLAGRLLHEVFLHALHREHQPVADADAGKRALRCSPPDPLQGQVEDLAQGWHRDEELGVIRDRHAAAPLGLTWALPPGRLPSDCSFAALRRRFAMAKPSQPRRSYHALQDGVGRTVPKIERFTQ